MYLVTCEFYFQIFQQKKKHKKKYIFTIDQYCNNFQYHVCRTRMWTSSRTGWGTGTRGAPPQGCIFKILPILPSQDRCGCFTFWRLVFKKFNKRLKDVICLNCPIRVTESKKSIRLNPDPSFSKNWVRIRINSRFGSAPPTIKFWAISRTGIAMKSLPYLSYCWLRLFWTFSDMTPLYISSWFHLAI